MLFRSVWLGVGHSDTIYDRERPLRVDRIRMGYASDPSAPLLAGSEAIRPIHGPSFNAPENDRSRPAGGEVTATAGRSQAHAAETTTTVAELLICMKI